MAKTGGLTTKGKVAQAILVSLAVGGFIAVAVLAPNALQLLGPLTRKSKRDLHNRRYYVKSTISRLAERELIVFKNSESGKTYARLTTKGRHELLRYKLEELVVNKPRRWDGKWRGVAFDIKELKRVARNRLRRELVDIGFVRLQNSVWVYPYECDEFIALLKTYYGLGKSLLYLVVDKLENDSWIRERFSLV